MPGVRAPKDWKPYMTFWWRREKPCARKARKVIGVTNSRVVKVKEIYEQNTRGIFSSAVYILCNILIHGQAGRSTVWANGTQNLGLVNFLPESRLPFTVQISSIYQKTTAKALTRYQRWLWRNGSRISVWIFRPEKQDNLFRCSVAPGNFLMERPKKSSLRGRRSRAQIPPSPSPFNYKKSCAIYFPTEFSGKFW